MSVEEREAILDYLHGDIPPREAKACCYYEYSRTSEVIRKARREILRKVPLRVRRKLQRKYDSANVNDLLKWIAVAKIPAWLQDWRRLEILICPGYPELPWRELNDVQRKAIQIHFVETRSTPVVTDSWMLNAMGVFDRLKEQAESDRRECRKRVIRRGGCPAMVGENEIKYVVLTINFRDGIETVKEQIARWLASDANQKLFSDYRKRTIDRWNLDSPTRYKELLKYLATWRLHDELGFKKAAEWTKTNRRRKDYHVLPFFREKLRKTPSGMHYTGPVFKDGRQWEDARDKAKSFLAKEIEYGQADRNVG